MHDHPNGKSAHPPASKAVRAETRELLIRQMGFSRSEAAYPGVEKALDRAAQALIEARLLVSGLPMANTKLK